VVTFLDQRAVRDRRGPVGDGDADGQVRLVTGVVVARRDHAGAIGLAIDCEPASLEQPALYAFAVSRLGGAADDDLERPAPVQLTDRIDHQFRSLPAVVDLLPVHGDAVASLPAGSRLKRVRACVVFASIVVVASNGCPGR
jgi:hypothetical protein